MATRRENDSQSGRQVIQPSGRPDVDKKPNQGKKAPSSQNRPQQQEDDDADVSNE